MTFVVVNAVRWSLAARLDMVVPSLKADTPDYTPGTGASLLQYRLSDRCPQGMAVTKKRAGSPRPAVRILLGTRSGRVTSGRRHQDGVDHMDHAVRLIDVRDRDGRRTALGVDDRSEERRV